jgi:hypothetical protein
MIKRIISFFANLGDNLFALSVEREIYHRIAPQINREKDFAYSFRSKPGLRDAALKGHEDFLANIKIIEWQAENMGKFYGEAFRYIMYRDLNNRIREYLHLAQWRVDPDLRITEFM